MVVRGGSVLTRTEKSLFENAPVADGFVKPRCCRIVYTSLHRNTGRNQIREGRERAEAKISDAVNQRANIRVPVDALEKSAAVIPDVANLSDIVPINLALNAE